MKQRIKSSSYVSKHSKPTDHNIRRVLLTSFLGMILCIACLAETTWAWFSANIQTQPQTIEAAHYDIEVLIADENNQLIEKTEKGYLLLANTEYNVTLTAEGNAPSGGYCVVNEGGNSFYTRQILPGEKLIFKLVSDKTADYTFTAVWGSYLGEPNITDNCTIGQKVEMQPIPEETDAIPEETDVIPEETDVIPEETDTIPEETDTIPEESAPTPEESSPTLEESSPMPEESSPISEEVVGPQSAESCETNSADCGSLFASIGF